MERKSNKTRVTVIILLVIAIAAGAVSFLMEKSRLDSVAIDSDNFPDVAVMDYVKKFDTNHDGYLSKSECKKVEKISIVKFLNPDDTEGKPVYYKKSEFTFDYSGLENFPNIKELSVNLSGGFTKKEKHFCSQIFHSDVIYTFKSLKSLELCDGGYNNIDLSRFENLKKVAFTGKGFSGLNIASETLEQLKLDNTHSMKELDFSDCTALKKVQIDDPGSCNLIFGENSNTISELTLGMEETNAEASPTQFDEKCLTGLKKAVLINLVKNDYDFSAADKLSSLHIENSPVTNLNLSANTTLKELSLWGCKSLGTVTLSRDAKIEWIRAVDCNLWSLNGFLHINGETLKTLTLFNNPMTQLNLTMYPKLETVTVNKGVQVSLAPGLNQNIISYE